MSSSTSNPSHGPKRANFFKRMFNLADRNQSFKSSSPTSSPVQQSRTVVIQPANVVPTGTDSSYPGGIKPHFTVVNKVASANSSPKSLGGSNSSIADDHSHSDSGSSTDTENRSIQSVPATAAMPPASSLTLQEKAQAKNLEIRTPSRTYKKLIDPSTLSPDEIVRRFYAGNLSDVAISHNCIASWLGDANRTEICQKYMGLFDWQGSSILTALRGVCDKLYMRAESQQLDRVIEAFSERWCSCNPDHGFKSSAVVYTIAYSILLLNTDKHTGDLAAGKRITRAQYVSQTYEAIKGHINDSDTEKDKEQEDKNDEIEPVSDSWNSLPNRPSSRMSVDLGRKGSLAMKRWSANFSYSKVDNTTLVSDSTVHSFKEWEFIITSLLKGIYASIDLTSLNLAVEETVEQEVEAMAAAPALHSVPGSLSQVGRSPRTPTSPLPEPPKVYLHGQSSVTSLNSRYNGHGILSKFNLNRRSSFDTGNHSVPFYSSSKKTHAVAMQPGEHFGFSGALRAALSQGRAAESSETEKSAALSPEHASELYSISESFASASATSFQASFNAVSLLPNEELELRGSPWAKEGLLKFYSFVNATGQINKLRAFQPKKKDWIQGFVIVQRGYLRIFRFDVPMSAAATKAYALPSEFGAGEGNWLERSVMTDNIALCHCMAQIIPNEAVSKGCRNGLAISNTNYNTISSKTDLTHWCLTLPNDTVLVFKAGTHDIADEYVYACNYWAARISRKSLVESITSAEYGWVLPIKILDEGRQEKGESYFPRIMSYANDIILINGMRVHLRDWHAPLYSSNISSLDDEDQLSAAMHHKASVAAQFERHNALLVKLKILFPSKFPVSSRVMANWERKSQYLLKENIKCDLYIASLERAISDKITTSD